MGISLSEGRLRVHLVVSGGDVVATSNDGIADGMWAKVQLALSRNQLTLTGEKKILNFDVYMCKFGSDPPT